jgi:hypothetical protein
MSYFVFGEVGRGVVIDVRSAGFLGETEREDRRVFDGLKGGPCQPNGFRFGFSTINSSSERKCGPPARVSVA